MNVVLCEYAQKRAFTAGNKARTDTVQILIEHGYKHIPLFRSKNRKLTILAQMIWGCIRGVLQAGRGDIVFLQYPYYPGMVNALLFCALRAGRCVKRYKIYLLLHDVVGLRSDKDGADILRKEARMFNKLDRIICHNEKMRTALQNAGCTARCSLLGPFDYLCSDFQPADRGMGRTVVIAGNLSREKSGYIYALRQVENMQFNLYGLNYEGESTQNIKYCGKYAPEDLVKVLEGNFGLVWDGDSLETCTGTYGEYLRYNNPHKFSLYLAAGLPLIVWSQSALAPYVETHGLGLCVDSLLDLENIRVSPEDYQAMSANVAKYREEIVRGDHLVQAVQAQNA